MATGLGADVGHVRLGWKANRAGNPCRSVAASSNDRPLVCGLRGDQLVEGGDLVSEVVHLSLGFPALRRPPLPAVQRLQRFREGGPPLPEVEDMSERHGLL